MVKFSGPVNVDLHAPDDLSWLKIEQGFAQVVRAYRRRLGKAPTPIPDDIWMAAVELSHHFGLGAVSRELKLDYARLKRRAIEPTCPRTEFFELLNVPTGLVESCVLQLQSTKCQATVQFGTLGG